MKRILNRAALCLAVLSLGSVAFAGDLEDDWEGKKVYSRHNLRADSGRSLVLTTTNALGLEELIPMGTELTVEEVNDKLVKLQSPKFNKPIVIKYNARHTKIPFGGYLKRTFSLEPVAVPTEGLSELDRQQIAKGELAVGMSRNAVLLAVGYPPANLNNSFEAKELVYMKGKIERLPVLFEGDTVSFLGTPPDPDKWEGHKVYNKVGFRADFKGDKHLAYSTNQLELSKHFPPNTEFKFDDEGSQSFTLITPEGTELEFKFNPSHSKISLAEFLDRTFSKGAPLELPATLTAREKELVAAGRIEPGMSREAVFLSIGYPPASKNNSFTGPNLIYMRTGFKSQTLAFEGDKLASVE